MRVPFSAALALSFASLPQTAHAEYFDGNKIYDACSAEKGSTTYYQDESFCTGYVIGVVDQLLANKFMKNGTITLEACLPEGVIVRQVVDVVRSHLKNNPQDRNLPGALLTWTAVNKAWPCK